MTNDLTDLFAKPYIVDEFKTSSRRWEPTIARVKPAAGTFQGRRRPLAESRNSISSGLRPSSLTTSRILATIVPVHAADVNRHPAVAVTCNAQRHVGSAAHRTAVGPAGFGFVTMRSNFTNSPCMASSSVQIAFIASIRSRKIFQRRLKEAVVLHFLFIPAAANAEQEAAVDSDQRRDRFAMGW